MKFVKKHVPDKRWNDNKRPVLVNGNPLLWILWALTSGIKRFVSSIKLLLEKSFVEIQDTKEEARHEREEE